MGRTDSKERLQQSWVEWIRPLGLIILAALAYGGYRFDLIGEATMGIVAVVGVLVGLIAVGLVPAWGLTRRPIDRPLLLVVALLALAGSAWPSLRAAWAPPALARAHLDAGRLSASLSTGASGPYELVVAGRLKGGVEAEASYTLDLDGGGKEQVSGDIRRAVHRYRTSRRGGSSTAIEEHTESVHRLKVVQGETVTVATSGLSDQLEGGLEVALRSAGPRPEAFWLIGALAVLLALVMDVRLTAPAIGGEPARKRELSYLTSVTAMLLVFTINYAAEATPRTLVRAAVGAFFLALIAGGAGGWLVAAFARLAFKGKRRASA